MEKSVLRIIDANFNRSREALRVIEEYCRFCLDDSSAMGVLKQMRHRLCASMKEFEAGELLSSRDTQGDVGTTLKVQGQLCRGGIEDAVTAAFKRLEEALRALAEFGAAEQAEAAAVFEQLRYQTYTLEKEFACSMRPRARFADVRLYILITSNDPERVLDLTHACIRGGADCIQLRMKMIEDDLLLETAERFAFACREHGVMSIINDRIDVAVLSGADGVHLGQTDLCVESVRKLQRRPLIVGRSTHTLEQLRDAIAENPTYVALGPAYSTKTKPHEPQAGLDFVSSGIVVAEKANVPHVVIGGITQENMEAVFASGAKCVAICSAVTDAESPESACRAIKAQSQAYFGDRDG